MMFSVNKMDVYNNTKLVNRWDVIGESDSLVYFIFSLATTSDFWFY
jgi:hypothetical protein